MKLLKNIFLTLAALLFSLSFANAGEKWDMALAYGAGNFHSANATEFAKNVTDKSGGKLTIVTHPGGSLFKGGEIFRAVRTGQAPIGERFMSALGKEDPLLEIDSQPFLATSNSDAMKLYKASKDEIYDYIIMTNSRELTRFCQESVVPDSSFGNLFILLDDYIINIASP